MDISLLDGLWIGKIVRRTLGSTEELNIYYTKIYVREAEKEKLIKGDGDIRRKRVN